MTTADSYTSILLPTALATALTPDELQAAIRVHLLTKSGYAKRGVDYAGLSSLIPAPTIAPATVRFRDPLTGQWRVGVSEPKIDLNAFRIDLRVCAYAPCARKAHWGKACGCKKRLEGVREGPANLLTNVFGKMVQAAILGATQTITDTGSTGRSVTKTVDGGVATLTLTAGTGGTAATVADTNMQTNTETQTSTTVNAISGSGSTGTFTVTGTITATADRAYQEVGLRATTTTSSWVFQIAHDSFSVLNVSNTGTLSTTYTFTNS